MSLGKHDFSRAVDGNTADDINASCINIEQKGNSWWGVNLDDQEAHTVLYIRIVLAKAYNVLHMTESIFPNGKGDFTRISGDQHNIRQYVWSSNTRARLVGFYLKESERGDYIYSYSICELEVYGIKGSVSNIALNKIATMSSVPYYLSGPSLAVDGNPNQRFFEGSCFRTAGERDPWWQVDLDGIYVLFAVIIYNRDDCCD
ncbi:uncharacterized protein LOC123533103 [Mercenaria mercenaria]|uniref:uncharacterized protein LOC123533103 n=1 Tax=Mercenaria mercenaria TaxID=6596 RepID=UPI00234E9BBB|nr:uncharacterized protein LOC123533103 [Mercenaria mercenaria]